MTNQHFEKTSMDRVTGRIMDMLSERAELTATARQYIAEYGTGQPNRQWLEGVINAA